MWLLGKRQRGARKARRKYQGRDRRLGLREPRAWEGSCLPCHMHAQAPLQEGALQRMLNLKLRPWAAAGRGELGCPRADQLKGAICRVRGSESAAF